MEDKKREYTKKSVIREYVEVILVSTLLFLFIRSFVVQAFKIPSGSMLDTLQIGDHILVSKFIYWFTDQKRGDIIVFKYPKDKKRDFIKRAIGLPGETIQIKDQVVYIDGKPLEEIYTQHQKKVPLMEQITPRDNFGPFKIPEDSIFVMGDNRDSSMDSRYWGALKKELIRGEAFVIYWSIKPYNSSNPQDSLYQRFINYLVSFNDRIRWGRLGTVIH
jgi:signal peptidase I